ncbi:MAG: RNA polymerase sigma-70 factor [Tannerellaceae bacterium]|jgi:RNA polymerase sigma-70 factor (ECF subfamily)|nr:RNA polymerase sigma-70 factor [Tannerellaceae bacterium]
MGDLKHTPDPETLLWKTVMNDDEKAFETLFGLFYPPLCAYARRYVDSLHAREDIVQDVFAALWEDRKRLSIAGPVRHYLVAAVRNHCLNYLRHEGLLRNYREAIKETDRQDTNDIYLLTELYELLEKALSKLPVTYRLVFEMHRMEGKNYEEIAQSLNISVRTAKRYKSQVTDLLKQDLKDYLPLLGLLFIQ